MQLLPDFIRSSYARMQAYPGWDAPLKASAELLPTEPHNSDQAQFSQAQAFPQQGQLNETEALSTSDKFT